MEWRSTEIPPSEEKRKATLEKARQTMYSQFLLEAFPGILIMLDRELRYIIGTDSLIAENFGFADRQDLSGLPLAEIFRQLADASFAEQIAENCRAVLKNTRPLRYNARIRFVSGRQMHLAVSLSPVLDHKAVSQGVLALLNDVTELTQTKEQAEAACAAQSDLFAKMSREIRTHMDTILKRGNLLGGTQLTETQRGYVGEILGASGSLLGVVDSAPDFFLPDRDAPVSPLSAQALPVGEERNRQPDAPPEEAIGSFKVKDARVLLVDDNEINLLVAEELLRSSGLEVVCASSGPDAVREAKDRRFDLIFMDHMMPDMDGVEATAQIRDLGDWNATVPVIALTANDDLGIREFFLENKMSDYLSKPLDVGQLNGKLLRWLPADKILREEPAETSEGSKKPSAKNKRPVPFKSELLRQVEQRCPIQVRATLTQIGGSEEVYLSVLHAFLNGAKHTLNVLPIYVEEQRWDDFRIKVHGEKSAMANIGANDLSDMARALEIAALSGDYDYIRENTASFCAQLDLLRGQLVEILPIREESNRQTADAEDRRDLLQEAAEIDALVDDLENERALERMEPLLRRSYGEKPDRLLEDIRLAIEDFQYDRASALLHELINSQGGNA